MTNSELRQSLLGWYNANKRSMPWRDSGNPYYIWLSEIMLQQTRVDQATPYFNRFVERFPTVDDLAAATQQEVLAVWEGLGYYSRARYLHAAAQKIVDDFDGTLPSTWDAITDLKGIGPYTASAVLSIAFNKPYAVVDGNVIRVLSRLYGIQDDVRKTATKNRIQEHADELLDQNNPGDFNQALMELGATVCTPGTPNCSQCPVSSHCVAYKTAKTETLPYKSKKKKVPHHHIGAGIIINPETDEVLIALRPEDGMLGGLWEFPGGKKEENETIRDTVVRELDEELSVKVRIVEPFMTLKHAYSHFKITLHAFICVIERGTPAANASQQLQWVHISELQDYPFPKANRRLTEKLMSPDFRQKKFNF